LSDLANLTIWDDPAIRGALSWYLWRPNATRSIETARLHHVSRRRGGCMATQDARAGTHTARRRAGRYGGG
jgi:hypothetical protein